MDDEPFWATVSNLAERFRDNAPDGMTAVVDFETKDGRLFRPIVVQTQKTGAWLAAEIEGPGETRELLFVRQEDVRRVQVRHESAGKQPLGFRVGDIEPR